MVGKNGAALSSLRDGHGGAGGQQGHRKIGVAGRQMLHHDKADTYVNRHGLEKVLQCAHAAR